MFDHDVTPRFVLHQLVRELRLRGQAVDCQELETFVLSAWPRIEDDPGDLARWEAEFLAGRQPVVTAA